MERRQIAMKLAMDHLHLPVQVRSFEDRLILQKAVYLAQATGVHLGYYFRWYLRGPYCPAVADDGFGIAMELARKVDDSKGWSLDAQSCRKLAAVRALMGRFQRPALARKLELLASVHFLIDRKQVAGSAPEKIAAVLRRFGKAFDAKDVAGALGELRDHGILC